MNYEELKRKLLWNKARLKGLFQRVFDSPDGRLVLEQIAKDGYLFKPTFVKGDRDETLMNEGSRRLALSIIKMATTDDTHIQKIIEEGMQHAIEKQYPEGT